MDSSLHTYLHAHTYIEHLRVHRFILELGSVGVSNVYGSTGSVTTLAIYQVLSYSIKGCMLCWANCEQCLALFMLLGKYSLF